MNTASRAFTLIEVLVVVSILGVLAVLMTAAVAAARESARRATCSNNLGRIGLALNAYSATYNAYPRGRDANGYSPHVALLPYLDQASLYQGVNLSLPNLVGRRPGERHPNSTATEARIAVYLCPSDPVPPRGGRGDWGVSYAGNTGLGRPLIEDGVFLATTPDAVRPSRIPDGAHATVAMAEWVKGPIATGARDAKGSIFEVPVPADGPDRYDAFAAACMALDPSRGDVDSNDKGASWMAGDDGQTLYNHATPVNARSCIGKGLARGGAYAAGSRHPGGGHALFVDGHVAFQSETTALKLWRDLGSRNGGESPSGVY